MVKTPLFSLQAAGVQSLAGELRCYMLCCQKKNKPNVPIFLKVFFFFLITFKKVLTQYCKSAVCAELLSCVWLFATPWTVAHQAPLSLVILQARILEWVAMPTSRGSSQPRDQTQDSCIAGGVFTIWEISYTSIKKKRLACQINKKLLNVMF